MTIIADAQVQVNDTTANNQRNFFTTSLSDGGWVVAWDTYYTYTTYSGGHPTTSYRYTGAYLQAYNADGTPRGGEIQVTSTAQSGGHIVRVGSLADGGWVATWQMDDGSNSGVFQKVFNADASVRVDEERVNSHTTGNQYFSGVSGLEGGGWVVAWISVDQDGDGNGVFQQSFDSEGGKVGTETQVNSFTTGYQGGHRLTPLQNGSWLVTWVSLEQDGSSGGIYQQRFGSDGIAVGDENRINSTTSNQQTLGDIAILDDGGWIVVWQSEYQDGESWGIYSQRFASDGTAVGGETLNNTTTAGAQEQPYVSALRDGGWVVTWISALQDGDSWGIFQQAYDKDGAPLDGETQVNQTTSGAQWHHRSEALTGGGWVVTWLSWSSDSNSYAVMMRAYDSQGKPLGDEVQVDSFETFPSSLSQYPARISALTGGEWVVTWESFAQDGDEYGIFQKRFHINHAPALDGKTHLKLLKGSKVALNGNVLEVSDPDNDTLVLKVILAKNGHVAFKANPTKAITNFTDANIVDGSVVFVHNGKVNESALIKFRAVDDDGVQSSIQTLTIDVTNVQIGTRKTETLNGTRKADDLIGKGGADTINGKGGGDTINGGKGRDKLTGGKGKDKFVFHKNDGNDTINDFEGGKDKIVLKGFGFKNKKQALKHFYEIGTATDDKAGFDYKGTKIIIKGADLKDIDAGDIVI